MTTAAPVVERLAAELERLPAGRAAALRVAQLVDDDRSSAAGVAAAASADPAMVARLLRMANSAYYGLSGRVSSVQVAVTVVGFQTVRSLAVLAAAGVTDGGELPPRFWARSAAVATGASLVAARVAADGPQAFCAGMLHDLGTALLWRADPEQHGELLRRAAAGEALRPLELLAYGGTHAGLAADVLHAWHFPEDLCVAIGRHHDEPSEGATPLRRALQGGIALAGLSEDDPDARGRWAEVALRCAGVKPAEVVSLVEQVRRGAQELSGTLGG